MYLCDVKHVCENKSVIYSLHRLKLFMFKASLKRGSFEYIFSARWQDSNKIENRRQITKYLIVSRCTQ